MVRGDRVRFHIAGTDEDARITLPEKHCVLHDPAGHWLRTCDVYFVAQGKPVRGIDGLDDDVAREARDYFGSDAELAQTTITMPPEKGWKLLGDCDLIEYVRYGKLAGGYHHPFRPAVPVYHSSRTNCWKIPLPDGCRLTDRGFVWP